MILLLVFLLAGCSPAKPLPDAGACEAACLRIESLGCPEAKPTAGGASCAQWCTKYAALPAGVDPHCMARVEACEALSRCGR